MRPTSAMVVERGRMVEDGKRVPIKEWDDLNASVAWEQTRPKVKDPLGAFPSCNSHHPSSLPLASLVVVPASAAAASQAPQ